MNYFLRRRYLPLVIAIDKIGGAYVKIKRVFVKPKQFDNNRVEKILIMSLDLIGDGILAAPAIKTIRENFPQAEITALVGQWNKEIFENNPNINRVKVINPFWTRSIEMSLWKRIISYITIYFKAEKDKYDLGIDLRGEFLSILLMEKMGVKYKIGYGITGGGWMLDKCVKYEGDRFAKHTVERNLDLLRSLNLKISDNLNLAIYPTEENKKNVDKFFADNNLSAKDKIAVIHPGSNDQARCWNNERWAEVINCLVDDFGYEVILSGDSGDKTMIDDIMKHITCNMKQCEDNNVACFRLRVSCFMGYSILDFAELLGRASLLLCVNSASLHIGAARQIPMVVLFAGSYPKTYGPWQNKNSVVLFKDAECFPCGKKVCENNRCMKDISVEEVIDSIRKIF